VVLPTLIALMLLFNPSSFVPSTTTILDMAKVLALRNLSLTGVLAYVLLIKKDWKLVGYLLIARGVTDIGDFLATFASTGELTASTLFPLVGSFVTLAAARYFLKHHS